MRLPFRIFLILLCALLIVSMPFFLSSPTAVYVNHEESLEDETETDEGEELDFGRLFFPGALAEQTDSALEVSEADDPFSTSDNLTIPDEWKLPIDFSIPPMPDPDKFTENGYEDRSIRVRIETYEIYDSSVHAAFVEVADASQLRTATAYGIKSKRTLKMYNIAKQNNAVIAMNGDLFVE